MLPQRRRDHIKSEFRYGGKLLVLRNLGISCVPKFGSGALECCSIGRGIVAILRYRLAVHDSYVSALVDVLSKKFLCGKLQAVGVSAAAA